MKGIDTASRIALKIVSINGRSWGRPDDTIGIAGVVNGIDKAHIAFLNAAWPTDLPQGVVHADYFPDNVFFREARFSAAFDFYFAAWDALAYDIGVALNAWCFEPDGSFNVTAARAFVAGYESRRPLWPDSLFGHLAATADSDGGYSGQARRLRRRRRRLDQIRHLDP